MPRSDRQCLRIFVLHACARTENRLPQEEAVAAEEFIRRLAERGHVVHVATHSMDFAQSMPASVTLHRLRVARAWGPLWRLVFMLNLRSLFKALQREASFDLVHQVVQACPGLSLALYGLHDTVVLGPFVPDWPEATNGPSSGWRVAIRQWIVRLQQRHASSLLLTTAAALSRITPPRSGGPLVLEVPHGVDPLAFEARTITPGEPSVLFLASIWRRKGIFTLLDAIAAVREQLPEATLTIAGHGPDEQLVRFAIERHPARDAIRVVGHSSPADVPEMIRSHAVYCLPSTGEPFGTSILEAMSCGVPVVSTNVGGPAYIVDDRGGRLVAPDDSAALAEALVDVLRSGSRIEAMGRHNRAVVERRFTWDCVLDSLEDAYYGTLDRRDRMVSEALAPRPSEELPTIAEPAFFRSYTPARVSGPSPLRAASAAQPLGSVND